MKRLNIFPLLLFPWIAAGQVVLKSELRTNGKVTQQAFSPLEEALGEASAVFYEAETFGGRRHVFFGTVVSSEGHILTKASELVEDGVYSVRIGPTVYETVTVVSQDEEWDVALVKVDAEGLPAAKFAETSKIDQGTWVIANGPPTRRTRRVRVGVTSAHQREIQPMDATLGIYLDQTKNELVISEILEKGGAADSDLQVGDQILKVDGKELASVQDFVEVFEGRVAGSTLSLTVKRGEEELEIKDIELRKPSEVFGKESGDRNDSMSGEFSLRRADFPNVLQHTIHATPRSIGGPVLTLNGECIGMNIARADRVTTFAIPVENLREILKGFGL